MVEFSPTPCTVKESSGARCAVRSSRESLGENASEQVFDVAGGIRRGASKGTMSHQCVSNVAFDPSRGARRDLETSEAEW
jgi:hypothetical protein